MPPIKDFHAHVYFAQETLSQATALCERVRDQFDIPMGRIHQRPVGPHPVWSCQLSVSNETFSTVIPWLSLNRDGLTIFVHPNTEDDWSDHALYAMWMGQMLPLDLSIFAARAEA